MTGSRKKSRDAAGLPPLSPAAASTLQAQIASLTAALEAGQDLESLKSLVTPQPRDPAWDVHLLASLGALPHPAMPPLLAALFGSSRDQERRKALNKALHRLKTRGVPVPADLLPREEVSPAAGGRPQTKATVSSLFGHGECYVVLEGPREILGATLLVARVSDREGLQECHLMSLKGKERSEFWDHFRTQLLGEWFPVPTAYAVRLLEEAYALDQGSPGTGRYGTARARVLAAWGHPQEAPDLRKLLPPLALEDRSRLLEQSRALARHPWFQSWIPGREEIAPWVQKIEEVRASPLVLTEQQQRLRLDTLVDEATGVLYPQEDRQYWGRRLLTTAYYLDLQGRGEEARAAQASGEDLLQPRSLLAGENPFLSELVQISLHLASAPPPSPPPETDSDLLAPRDPLLIRR